MELPCFFEPYSPNFKGVHVHLCIFEYLPKTPKAQGYSPDDLVSKNSRYHSQESLDSYNDGHLGGLDLPNIGFLADAWILEVLEY